MSQWFVQLDSSTTTTTLAGEQVEEQLQESMATSSELVGKAAEAVDASAKATTELQETVEETTDALKTLTEAQTKTEVATPCVSYALHQTIKIGKLHAEAHSRWQSCSKTALHAGVGGFLVMGDCNVGSLEVEHYQLTNIRIGSLTLFHEHCFVEKQFPYGATLDRATLHPQVALGCTM